MVDNNEVDYTSAEQVEMLLDSLPNHVKLGMLFQLHVCVLREHVKPDACVCVCVCNIHTHTHAYVHMYVCMYVCMLYKYICMHATDACRSNRYRVAMPLDTWTQHDMDSILSHTNVTCTFRCWRNEDRCGVSRCVCLYDEQSCVRTG